MPECLAAKGERDNEHTAEGEPWARGRGWAPFLPGPAVLVTGHDPGQQPSGENPETGATLSHTTLLFPRVPCKLSLFLLEPWTASLVCELLKFLRESTETK